MRAPILAAALSTLLSACVPVVVTVVVTATPPPQSVFASPTPQQHTASPLGLAPEEAVLEALQVVVDDPRYDPSASVLRDYLPYLAVSIHSGALTYSVQRDVDSAEDFISLGMDLILFSAVVVDGSTILDVPLTQVEVVSRGPRDTSATVSVSGRSNVIGIADGSLSVSDVMQADVDWGNVPPTPVARAISCWDTNSLSGQTTTCRIERAYCSYRPDIKGAPTFCNDAPYPGHAFTLLVWGADWSRFDGQCLDVTGLVVRYQGKPEIVADNLSQVSRCE